MGTITSIGTAAFQSPMFGFQGKITDKLTYRNWREAAVYMPVSDNNCYTYISEREIPGAVKGEWHGVYSVLVYSGCVALKEEVRNFKRLKDAFAYVNKTVRRTPSRKSRHANERHTPDIIFHGSRELETGEVVFTSTVFPLASKTKE